MTNETSIANWNEPEILNAGRMVQVKDDCQTYNAFLPAAMDLDDAIGHFSASYDTNGESINLPCSATLYVDGNEVESRDFTIEVA